MEQLKFQTFIMKKTGKPTSSELEILSILWEQEAATVKEVHEVINARN